MKHHHPPPPPPRRATDGATLDRTAALFRALGDASRLRLLEALSAGERCVSELAEDDGMSTISQRLRVLHQERLVQKRREGKHVYYALADAHVAALVRAGVAHAREANPPRAPKPRSPEAEGRGRKDLSVPTPKRRRRAGVARQPQPPEAEGRGRKELSPPRAVRKKKR